MRKIYGKTKPPKGALINFAHPLTRGLVGYWPMLEGNGDKVYDLSGNKNTGTLTSMAFPSTPASGWNPGKFGYALSFDGTNDYVDCGNNASLQITNKLTVELWIKANQPSATIHYAIAKDHGWGFWVDGTHASYTNNIGVYYNHALTIIWTGAFPSGLRETWVHIVFTYENPNTELFVNGVSKGVKTDFSGDILTAANLNIGRRSDGAWPFGGLIDEVRIYNRALSEKEVLQSYIEPFCMFNR